MVGHEMRMRLHDHALRGFQNHLTGGIGVVLCPEGPHAGMVEAVVELNAGVLIAALAEQDVLRDAAPAMDGMPQLEIAVADGDEGPVLHTLEVGLAGRGKTGVARFQTEAAQTPWRSLVVEIPAEARNGASGVHSIFWQIQQTPVRAFFHEVDAFLDECQLLGGQFHRDRLHEERLVAVLHRDKIVRKNRTNQRHGDKNYN